MHDGGGADAGVVDQGGAACADDGDAGEGAEAGLKVEGFGEDAAEDAGDVAEVCGDDVCDHEEIDADHEGHEDGGHAGDARDAAEHDESDDHGDGEAEDEAEGAFAAKAGGAAKAREEGAAFESFGGGERGDDGFGQLVGVDDAQRAEHTGHGEEDGEGFPARTEGALDDVHDAAAGPAVAVDAFEHDGERSFVELGAHSHQSAYPHPEDGARSSDDEGDGHAGDVAQTHGAGHGRQQRLNRRNLAVTAFAAAFAQHADRGGETAQRDEPASQKQVEAAAD